jgi:hypothetical protein
MTTFPRLAEAIRRFREERLDHFRDWKIKRWQVAVLIGGGLAVIASGWYWLARTGSSVKLASSIVMVDVTSGELFEYSVGGRRAVMVPGRHPDSGALVLLPVYRNEAGQWLVGERDRGALEQMEGPATAIDPGTGAVNVRSGRVRRVR